MTIGGIDIEVSIHVFKGGKESSFCSSREQMEFNGVGYRYLSVGLSMEFTGLSIGNWYIKQPNRKITSKPNFTIALKTGNQGTKEFMDTGSNA